MCSQNSDVCLEKIRLRCIITEFTIQKTIVILYLKMFFFSFFGLFFGGGGGGWGAGKLFVLVKITKTNKSATAYLSANEMTSYIRISYVSFS